MRGCLRYSRSGGCSTQVRRLDRVSGDTSFPFPEESMIETEESRKETILWRVSSRMENHRNAKSNTMCLSTESMLYVDHSGRRGRSLLGQVSSFLSS